MNKSRSEKQGRLERAKPQNATDSPPTRTIQPPKYDSMKLFYRPIFFADQDVQTTSTVLK